MIRHLIFDRIKMDYVSADEERHFVDKGDLWDRHIELNNREIAHQEDALKRKFDFYEEMKEMAAKFGVGPPESIDVVMPEMKAMHARLRELYERDMQLQDDRWQAVCQPKVYHFSDGTITSLSPDMDDMFVPVDAITTPQREPLAYLFPMTDEEKAEIEDGAYNPLMSCLALALPTARRMYSIHLSKMNLHEESFIKIFKEATVKHVADACAFHLLQPM